MTARLFARQTRREASTPAQSNRPAPKHEFEIRGKRIRDFVFLHDNIHIVSGSEDGTMCKWDGDTGLLVGKPWKSEGGRMYALDLSPDGRVIASGRADGSVQRWNTDGKMMLEGVWRGHRNWVRSLSWSPSGGHIASGSFDGEILIRKGENGGVEVGPIKTNQVGVSALAYSPSGERLASGGYNSTICIWDTKTGKLAVGPIKNLGNSVMSVVWSSDNTKLYSASDFFARVVDSKSGTLLHSLEHDHILFSVALSPKNNVLACVGSKGVAQLWDIEPYQPLGQPFHNHESLRCVTFSRDGNHLAYCGMDGKVALWRVKDIVPEIEPPTLPQQAPHGQLEAIQQPEETRPQSPSSSCLNADATGGDGIIEDVCDDPYNKFFQSSQTSLPPTTSGSPQSPNPSPARRFWKMISRDREPVNESIPLWGYPKRKFSARHACSNSSSQPAATTPNQQTPEWKVRAEENDKANTQDVDLPNCPTNAGLDANNLETDEGKRREGSLTNTQNQLVKLGSEGNFWKWPMRARGKDTTSVNLAPRPEVVEVYAVRGFQRYVALTSKRKAKSSAVMCSAPLAAVHKYGSSQPAPSSLVDPAQAGTLLQASSGQGGSSSLGTAAQGTPHLQAVGAHTLPSCFVTTYRTNHDSDSRSSIEGPCNRFLDKICFPCGHYYANS